MRFDFPCPYCSRMNFALPSSIGKTTICRQCSRVINVPAFADLLEDTSRERVRGDATGVPVPHQGFHAFGPHARGNEPPGCLGWGALSIIALVIIILTWPVSFFVVLAGVLIYLTFADRSRNVLLAFFRDADVSKSVERSRRKAMFILITISAMCTLLNALVIGSPAEVSWWVLAALLWTGAIHLGVVQLVKNKTRHKFAYALLTNAREFVFTITLVLGLYAILAMYVSGLPLENATLFKLRQWEANISRIHVFLQGLKFSALQLLVLFTALVSLRAVKSCIWR
jgi:hypothetical protein